MYSNSVSISPRRRLALGLGATAVVLGAALTAAPSQAAALVVVPSGCGALSGTVVSASRLDDQSGDGQALGSLNSHYTADVTLDMITVGTAFDDFIDGTNGVDDTICGLQGIDTLTGAGGDDHGRRHRAGIGASRQRGPVL